MPQAETHQNGHVVELPTLNKATQPLDRVIEVDYYIPGCPPTPEILWNALTALLEGRLPAKGAVLADNHTLCDSCSRRHSKPEKLDIDVMKRVYQTEICPDRCFLAQSLVCLGPATRGGCQERCLKANMPCTGCFGPTDQVMEQGAKFLSCLASQATAKEPQGVEKFVASLPDPAGLFYRYSLAASALKGTAKKERS
jgi:F420-non-reducing hydrogenase small subunit